MVYIYIYVIYIYICMLYVYIYVHMYIYIYIYILEVGAQVDLQARRVGFVHLCRHRLHQIRQGCQSFAKLTRPVLHCQKSIQCIDM